MQHVIRLSLTTFFNPEANGKIERGHPSIWPRFLPFTLWEDRMMYTRATGFMPTELMYCQKPVFPIETQMLTWLMLPWNDGMTREELLSLSIKQPCAIEIDDWVLAYDSTFDTHYDARKKLIKRWFGPYVLTLVFENGTYALCKLDGTPLRSLIIGKRIKLFKRNNVDYEIDQELLEDANDADADVDADADADEEQ
ncbi:hypothetical protein KP509_17G071900 [Ceratopteris richardii]|uniref:Uncharacterized protein n=1 Tax=Ceratopteris richardii TaxID=49495 RepID=A0A8T2SV63_CERRI|nr:hypothetical protein KP509_17G071900 [Ceratopteris richardii]